MRVYFLVVAALTATAAYAAYGMVSAVHLDRHEDERVMDSDAVRQDAARWHSHCYDVLFSPAVRRCGSFSTVGPWIDENSWHAQVRGKVPRRLAPKVLRRKAERRTDAVRNTW